MNISYSTIRETLENAGIDESAWHLEYSGRGMYGRQCFGFTGGLRDLCRFFNALLSATSYSPDENAFMERLDLADELADAVRSDSMGLDKIFYFPGFTLV